jgi:hypothetical protein
MQIKFIAIAVMGLLFALFYTYQSGYGNGFTAAASQMQEATIKQADIAVKKANRQVKKEDVIVSELIATQTDFLGEIDIIRSAEGAATSPFKALNNSIDKVLSDEQESPLCTVGIDANELRELQRITRSANAH